MKSIIKVSRSFLSLYFFIILLFIFASWLVDEFWRGYLQEDVESYTGYKVMLQAIEDYVERQPQDQWQEIVASAAKRYDIPLILVNEDKHTYSVSHYGNEVLVEGNTYIHYDDDAVEIHHIFDSAKAKVILGPTKLPTRPRVEAAVRVVLLMLLALIILCWLWPIARDLDRLRSATDKFGKGDFNVRVPEARSALVSSLVSGFNGMADRIKRLIEAHKELTNAVSHELRTPMARSKFALQMLSSVKDEQKREKYLNQVNGDIRELEALVNELLEYATLDSDTPDLDTKTQNANALITHQVGLFEQVGLSLKTNLPEDPVNIVGDRRYLERAISNLITNAIKYGGGKVEITLTSNRQYCEISIEDNGNGIADELKETIFDAFSRGEQSRNKETGGFGLGLAIVKRIVNWHNGEIFIRDSKLGGACFVLMLPLAKVD
ncbi:HAMP domain-containing sensor histidine kinase [Colwellia sp. MEBiC06753]